MIIVCPDGHETSEGSEYCDVCGLRITPSEPVPQSSSPLPHVEDADTDTSPAPNREPCPRCGMPRSADDRFCEQCGHDFLAPPTVLPMWEAVATADRERFEKYASAGIASPGELTERCFLLEGEQLRIGRSRGANASPPEIDFAGDFEDPGISRMHAVLERRQDGTYALRDLGSTNGTTVNGAPVGSEEAVPLSPGDSIKIGAWTTITVRSR